MSYLQTLTEDMKVAMKSKNKEKLSTLRLVITDLTNERIALNVPELNKEQEEIVLNRCVKKLDKEMESYVEVGKDTIKQQAEKDLILSYLPKKMAEDEIIAIVKETIVEVGATSKKEMGKVMAALKQKFENNADMGFVSKTVQSQLS